MDLTALYDELRNVVDNLVTVTLARPTSYAGAATAAVVLKVQEQAATQENVDSPMGGALDGVRKTFNVWRAECGGLVPYEGYTITTADGKVWVIKSVDRVAHGRRFRCHCLQRPVSDV